jgi:(2Fe-2S) ferredoxin
VSLLTARTPYEKYVFVCENKRTDGRACCAVGGEAVYAALKTEVKNRKLDARIRVSRSGCLDLCVNGPSVLEMPAGHWYQRVQATDASALLDQIVQTNISGEK